MEGGAPASVIGRSAIEYLSAGLAERNVNREEPAGSPPSRDSREKTGRRLTSDPIRTSLGLLPSGPDPVGEWLVHRQSPGPYLGPKGRESKRVSVGPAHPAGRPPPAHLDAEAGSVLATWNLRDSRKSLAILGGRHADVTIERATQRIGVREATMKRDPLRGFIAKLEQPPRRIDAGFLDPGR